MTADFSDTGPFVTSDAIKAALASVSARTALENQLALMALTKPAAQHPPARIKKSTNEGTAMLEGSATFGRFRVEITGIGIRFTRRGAVGRGGSKEWHLTSVEQLDALTSQPGYQTGPDAADIRRAVEWARQQVKHGLVGGMEVTR